MQWSVTRKPEKMAQKERWPRETLVSKGILHKSYQTQSQDSQSIFDKKKKWFIVGFEPHLENQRQPSPSQERSPDLSLGL